MLYFAKNKALAHGSVKKMVALFKLPLKFTFEIVIISH